MDSLSEMRPVKRVFGAGEATAFVAGGGPATDDDVSITNDGRRHDSAEAVLEFLEDLDGPVAQARTLDEVSAIANAIGEAPRDEYIQLEDGQQLRTREEVIEWVKSVEDPAKFDGT